MCCFLPIFSRAARVSKACPKNHGSLGLDDLTATDPWNHWLRREIIPKFPEFMLLN